MKTIVPQKKRVNPWRLSQYGLLIVGLLALIGLDMIFLNEAQDHGFWWWGMLALVTSMLLVVSIFGFGLNLYEELEGRAERWDVQKRSDY